MTHKNNRHIISVVVENKPGVLARIASLFSARGFNIESLNVGETENSELSRMTIVVSGDDRILEQVRKQLSKLIDTIKVTDITDSTSVESDLALVKIKVPSGRRSELVDIANLFQARLADVSEKHVIIEISGGEDKLESFLRLIAPYGISEMVRAGRIALRRGD
ncbi:MAG: acetolactate synthase small subunit [Planctomycetota bacterium]|jgi:acetolactate synthase-1/3 small subunit|nr:acetolactate synthase small subunit [Planctomycetota bacterium]